MGDPKGISSTSTSALGLSNWNSFLVFMKSIDKINGIVGIDHPNNVQLVLFTYDLGLSARRLNGITYADHFTVGQIKPDVSRCSTTATGRNPVPKACVAAIGLKLPLG